MSERKCLQNKRFSEVLVQSGTLFQSRSSWANSALRSSVILRLISLAIAPLESRDLSLAFQAIDH